MITICFDFNIKHFLSVNEKSKELIMLSCSLLASKVAYSFHLFAYKNFYSNICFPSRILPVSFRFSKMGLP